MESFALFAAICAVVSSAGQLPAKHQPLTSSSCAIRSGRTRLRFRCGECGRGCYVLVAEMQQRRPSSNEMLKQALNRMVAQGKLSAESQARIRAVGGNYPPEPEPEFDAVRDNIETP